MDLERIIKDLKQERDHIQTAIDILSKLEAGCSPRRGRPPAWLAALRKKDDAGVPVMRRRGRPQRRIAMQTNSRRRRIRLFAANQTALD